MAHRVDRIPRYSTEFLDNYAGPVGELLMDLDKDELVLQNEQRGGVRFTKDTTVNVLSFGAKRDGVSDDSPAIQAAIDYAYNHGKSIVAFPAGSYGMASKVYGRDGIYLLGLGHVELHRISHNYGTMIMFSPADDALDGDFLWQGPKDIGLINLIFQYHGDTLDVPMGSGGGVPLALGLCQNVLILNCSFYNRVGPHTIEVSGCKHVAIRDCKFFGSYEFNTDGIQREILQVEQSLTGAAVSQSNIPNAHSRSEDVTIDNCYFGQSSVLPTGISCVGNHTASNKEFPVIGLKIINCTFDSPQYAGVNVYASKNVVVDNCTFLNVPRCVRLMRRIPGAGGSGDWGLATNGLYFTNNFVEGSEGNGYLFESRNEEEYAGENEHRNINIVIANNTFRQRSGTGHIFLRNCTNTLIANNVFRGPCKVILSNAHGSFILKNNLLQDYTEHGVWNDERGVSAANTGIRFVVDSNVFLGDHTNITSDTDGRAVAFRNDANGGTAVTISNNVIESRFNSNYREQIQTDHYDYVVCHANVLYKTGADLYSITNAAHSNITTGLVV